MNSLSQQFIDFDPAPVIVANLVTTPAKVKLPAPRKVSRTRVAMLAAGAVFGVLSEAEQHEFDSAMGACE